MWMMCNDTQEGKCVPSLLELKAVEASTASMEVTLVDRYKDSRLRDLEDIAQELYFSAENSLMLAEKLAKLVAASMGYASFFNGYTDPFMYNILNMFSFFILFFILEDHFQLSKVSLV